MTDAGAAPAVMDDDAVGLIFPGQGSQSLGMAGKVLRIHPDAEERFRSASVVLGYDLLRLIEEGPLEELNDTETSQPAIFTSSVAWLDALRERWKRDGRQYTPRIMAGHSLGQITACVAAGALDFDDGVRLVQERGRLMREANKQRPGGMASIIGLRDRVLTTIVREAAKHGVLVVANDNCPGHSVVSGDEQPLREAMRLAEAEGARRVVRLPISIASHSPLMEGAQAQFRDVVAAIPWRDPQVPIVSNISAGLITTRNAVRDEMSEALCSPVRWTDAVKTMTSQGTTLFVEAGPGDVLTKLVRRIARSAWTFALSNEEEGLARRGYPDKSDGIPR